MYRISIYSKDLNLQFNHFLILDDEPLLYHAGMKMHFKVLHEAVSKLLDPSRLKWIGFSHFEADECGALNNWLSVAAEAKPICSDIGAMVNMLDYALRPAKGMQHLETFSTGKYHFQFIKTPHFPHGWDAAIVFEKTTKTLFASDILFHYGNVDEWVKEDILDLHASSLAIDRKSVV